MPTSLSSAEVDRISAPLRAANAAFAMRYPGERPDRQPVHTVYGGAHLFHADASQRLGQLALRALEEHAPDAATLARAFDLPPELAEKVRARVLHKLETEPVEDLRIDFEDGYGARPDAEEDGHAVGCAREVARGRQEGVLPPFVGIRIKSMTEDTRVRALRTLDLFLTSMLEAARGVLPSGFVVTLPKLQIPEHAAALADALDVLEPKLGLPPGAVRFEIMIEQTQAVLDAGGRVAVPGLVAAARGRCLAAHLGTYDYTASCGVTAAHQRMGHPACDFAKHCMQASLAGTGVWLSDGATSIMPVGDRATVHAAWRLQAADVQRSLAGGFYQGWDLHPAQLVARFTAVYAFYLEALPAATARLSNFVGKAAQATLVGEVFDDAATGQALLNFFLRGLGCGAIAEAEALATGLTLDELRSRSFLKILAGRRAARAGHG
ncbi:MAG TPA: phosphoenolpyruvate kinase [Polyangiaceae bacterium]|jgi:citrate lyase beta subunit